MILEDGERLEDLQCKGLKIIQNKNLYSFTSDSVVLANFVKAKKGDVAVEIGAGSGVISILVQAKTGVSHITAFEIQKQMADLFQKNLKLNGLEKTVTLVCDKVQNFEKYIKKSSADVVFSNPPYFKQTNFKQSEVKKIAKEDIFLPVKELALVASKMLKSGGSFFCCYSAQRLCELICSLASCNLAVKEMFFTENGKGEVKLVVCRAVKDGKNGVKVYKNLVTNEENGDYLEILKTNHFAQ